MKVFSWNVWSENTSLSQVAKFIKKQNADVVCLQEVSKKLLKKMQKLPKYTVMSAIDCYYVKSKKKKIPYYLVILSKLSIVDHQLFSIPTVQYESIVSQILGLEECIEGQYIDIMQHEKKIRIFNVHFQSYVRPRIRLQQFESVVGQFSDASENIICGDFNTFGFWHFNVVVGWIYNYSWEEFFMDEKSSLEGMLKKYKLVNVFNWEVTYPWLGTQLDFIVTEKRTRIFHKKIFTETFGSDHRPIFIKATI